MSSIWNFRKIRPRDYRRLLACSELLTFREYFKDSLNQYCDNIGIHLGVIAPKLPKMGRE